MAVSGTSLWLSQWTQDTPVNGTMDQDKVHFRLEVYAGLGATQGIAFMNYVQGTRNNSMCSIYKLYIVN